MTKLNAAGQAVLTAGPMLTMPDNVGQASTPNYGGFGSGIYGFNEVVGSGLVFAGQTDDPFFLDLRVFDLLYGANLSEAGTGQPCGLQRAHDCAAGAKDGPSWIEPDRWRLGDIQSACGDHTARPVRRPYREASCRCPALEAHS